MTNSEGVVAATNEQGKAHVVIRAGEPGPPCPSHPEGCLCSGSVPRFTVKAINNVNASVGDLVSVSFKQGAMMKSLVILLGIPSLCLLLGVFTGLVLQETFGTQPPVLYAAAATGLFVGVIFSVVTYLGSSEDIQPFISHIVRSGIQAPLLSRTIDPVCKTDIEPPRAAASLEYKGYRYYFCRPECLRAFVKGPGKYVSTTVLGRGV